jgi:hypothetical protein
VNRQPQVVSPWKVALAFLLIAASAGACRAGKTTEAPPASGTGTQATATPAKTATPATTGVPAASDAPAQTGVLLFRDDFQDGKAQEWSIASTWTVEQHGQVYLFGASGLGGAYVTNGGGWTGYTYQSAIRVNSGALLISINLSQSGRYGLSLGGDGVYLFEEQPAGTFNVLGEAGPITTGSWHRILFAAQGGHVQVSIDSVVWFDVTDPTPITKGTVAVSTVQGSRVGIDNVLVTTIQGTLPAALAQAPAPTSAEPVKAEEIQSEVAPVQADETDVQTVEEPTAPPTVVGGKPDLVLEDVSFTPIPIVQGQPFTANYQVANRGDAAAGAFTSSLHFHAAAGIADCNMDVNGLAPGELAWSSCTRTINGIAGDYPIEVTADLEGEITESDEGNNTTTSTITVNAPPNADLPDLTVTAVKYHGENAQLGTTYECDLSNLGTADSPPVDFEVLDHGALIYSAHGGGIPAGESLVVAFPVHADRPLVLTCIADPNQTITESNEDNNTLTTTIP